MGLGTVEAFRPQFSDVQQLSLRLASGLRAIGPRILAERTPDGAIVGVSLRRDARRDRHGPCAPGANRSPRETGVSLRCMASAVADRTCPSHCGWSVARLPRAP